MNFYLTCSGARDNCTFVLNMCVEMFNKKTDKIPKLNLFVAR